MNAFRLARSFKPATQLRKFSAGGDAAAEVAQWTKMTIGTYGHFNQLYLTNCLAVLFANYGCLNFYRMIFVLMCCY